MSAAIRSRTFGEAAIGEELPTLELALTARTIVGTAIASRDYQDVHHDRDAAQAKGTRDIFMNILSTNGYVLRLVTDWAGPDALITDCAIRLGVPNYAGDTMRLRGEVTEVAPHATAGTGGLVTISVTGTNGDGTHVTGTVTVDLPGEVA